MTFDLSLLLLGVCWHLIVLEGGFPSSFWNRVVTRIMLKNLQRLICEDRAVASRHAEVLQSPNSLEIFQGKSRGW